MSCLLHGDVVSGLKNKMLAINSRANHKLGDEAV